jgi:hypothetical protein
MREHVEKVVKAKKVILMSYWHVYVFVYLFLVYLTIGALGDII